jgi:S-formylglutathione hydrolase FrmB
MPRRPWRGVWLYVRVAVVFTASIRAEAGSAGGATRSAEADCVAAITFAVPASSAGSISQATVIVPHAYLSASGEAPAGGATTRPSHVTRFPVIYMLHGFGGNERVFYEGMHKAGRSLVSLADRFGAILVMPDGKCCSWYLNASPDTPDAADWQWETVITKRLIPEIDRRYRTWAQPRGRAITGVSMGGHGALYLAARHPELFCACSSVSGIMRLTDTTQPKALAQRLGSLEEHRGRWVEHSVLTQAERFAGRPVGVLIDCGRDDPFHGDNLELHARLDRLNVPHDYIERPGGHEGAYWLNALPYHLQFLSDRLKAAGSLP